MNFFEDFLAGIAFRLNTLTLLDVLDIALVTLAFYILLLVVRRSQAAILLRGIIILAGMLLVTSLLLPLPTFDRFIWFSLLIILITLPISLQPELRRWLEQIGRRIGFRFASRETDVVRVIPPVVRAVENLAATKTGALLVFEGVVSLQEIIESGIPVNANVTSELLQTIFFEKTPLHDGAVIIRGDRVAAAGCVLPLTDRPLPGRRRLGTRHRAAVGVTEITDALAIIVSEETGDVSIAEGGQLDRKIDRTALRPRLVEAYSKKEERARIQPRRRIRVPGFRQLTADIGYLFVAFLLALVAATAVRQQTNPLVDLTFQNVPLRVLDVPPDTTLSTAPPSNITVTALTTSDVVPSLSANSFEATITLAGLEAGPQRVLVNVTTNAENVLIDEIVPQAVDVTIAPIVSEVMPVTVDIRDQDSLSAAYEIGGDPIVSPDEVLVTGPEPDVARVARVRAAVSLLNASATVQDIVPVQALDEDGTVVEEVSLEPDQVQVTVIIRRRVDARDVGVRAATTGSPPEGYWLSGLRVEPPTVTIRGNPNVIAEMGSFIDTVPIDLTDATGEITIETPLDLPPEVRALDDEGEVITNVTVEAQVAARRGDLLVTRPVQFTRDVTGLNLTVEPEQVELLLSGPLPTLNEIEANPDLVRVSLPVPELEPGQSAEVIPEVIAPEGIRVQLVDASVLVTAPPAPEPEQP